MAIIQSIPLGMPVTLVANQIYAVPSVKVTLYTDATTPTIQQSGTSTFTANTAVTLTGGSATVSAPFIRATADTLVTLKRD